MSTTQNIIALESQIPTRVSDLENDAGYITGESGMQADWNETDPTAMGYIKNKPTVPAPVAVDATLTAQGAAADAKAVGDALRRGFTEWVCDEISDGWTFVSCEWDTVSEIGTGWFVNLSDGSITIGGFLGGNADSVNLEKEAQGNNPGVELSRRRITPTKTSQLTNDGDGTNPFVKTNDTRLSDARTPTAHHATHAANGSDPLAPADIGAAAAADLPYRLVEPGKWEFSDGGSYEISGPLQTSPEVQEYYWRLMIGGEWVDSSLYNSTDVLSVAFPDVNITATRPSLPGHLCDRAGNRVVVTGATTLTLPAANPGYLRDFLVRLEISGSTVPTITFQGQGSEASNGADEITYETDGDEFPVPDEAGDWLYSFTESCVAHKFAVALKKVNVVAQGGVT